jgi:hypothetical protein
VHRRLAPESGIRLVSLNAALGARLQAHGHRFAFVRLVSVLSPAVGRLAVVPSALDDLVDGLLKAALAKAHKGGTVVVETEQIIAREGVALADAVLGPGDYALLAVSALPTVGAPVGGTTEDAESARGDWRAAARALGGGGWLDAETDSAVAMNVLVPCASGPRIRLPALLRPGGVEGY